MCCASVVLVFFGVRLGPVGRGGEIVPASVQFADAEFHVLCLEQKDLSHDR